MTSTPGTVPETPGTGTSGTETSGEADAGPVTAKTDEQWRQELTPEEYRVLRQAGTERPYTGEYWDTHATGVYQCRACGSELFTSREKFDSHCGWPSFWAPLADGTVRYIHDRTLGMERVEVRCAHCDSHLGHVFEGEGYGNPTDQRFCINSVSLKLVPADDAGA
ncbi:MULTISPECIES: peptide-methionine (R)-S-oxide reductase MsrB [Arthrobacter]|uniref:peptide-methionine (R)-S-oxide reductase MsrB n=1 Tax=Arthrobacter TaxID=1663 RepID=UPI00215982D9|nr:MULTISPECIES: peptide-methionine (R)-S-oxide reductase MsrB [Arthrobacter]